MLRFLRQLFACLLCGLTGLVMDLLAPVKRRSPIGAVPEQPPAKINNSPSKKSKCARKAAAKQRLAAQDQETQIGDGGGGGGGGDCAVAAAAPPNGTANGADKKAKAQPQQPAKQQQQPCLSRKNIGANWQQAMAQAPTATGAAAGGGNVLKMRRQQQQEHPTPPKRLPVNEKGIRITKHLAMDCEMVGIGFGAKKHMVARVSIVNQMGEVLMDRYVRPSEPVVDYRTEVSGIRPADIANGDDFQRVQADVARLLDQRILVGHAVYNDLKVLAMQHPPRQIRDTSRYRPLINRITGGSTPSLKTLARCVLDVNIQAGEHSSVEDARAAMRIYNKYQEEWERSARRRNN